MGFGGVVGRFFWQKFDTGQRHSSDFPDVSVISYTGKPEYERVAFIRYDKRGKSEKKWRVLLQCDGRQKKEKKKKEFYFYII